MNEQYLSDHEYRTYFPSLNGLRRKIADHLPIRQGTHVLDLATGYGYFAVELARLHPTLKIVGVDISRDGIRNARELVEKSRLADRIRVLTMDATCMTFPDGNFDTVVNFLGLEDIHMTGGREGVVGTFHEVGRVLRRNGHFCFVVMPPDKMETVAQRTEVALFSHVCGATWLSSKEYEDMLKKTKFELIEKREYYTGKKLTPEQAKREIAAGCEITRRIYGIETPAFKEIWAEYGKSIEEDGLGHYSKVLLIVARKD